MLERQQQNDEVLKRAVDSDTVELDTFLVRVLGDHGVDQPRYRSLAIRESSESTTYPPTPATQNSRGGRTF
jgi:hypothetical protein